MMGPSLYTYLAILLSRRNGGPTTTKAASGNLVSSPRPSLSKTMESGFPPLLFHYRAQKVRKEEGGFITLAPTKKVSGHEICRF